jgi:hypothetical protein
LHYDNPAKKYVESRKIPTKHHHKLFLCVKFKEWVNTIIPDKFESTDIDEPRLIIPFIDMDGSLIGFTGRAFGNSKLRYITIHVDTEKPLLLAMGSSNNLNGLKQFIDDPSKFVIVLDNEPKNKDICSIVEKSIELGYNVCIWPQSIVPKDINELVLSGMKPEDVKLLIDCNTVSGLEAKLKLTHWKKC